MRTLIDSSVLVTGATGFVGSRLSELLSTKEKARVTGIGRELDRVAYLKDQGVDLRIADLMDVDALKAVIKGKEFVFHTAAVLDADPETAEKVNVDATETLVRLAAEAGVSRFVHVSTVGVYDMTNITTVDETAPLVPNHSSTYPRTKARAELTLIEAANKYGIEYAIVRPSMIYGPGHGIWTVGMFKNVMDENPVMLGNGSFQFNPVYNDDVVEAIILCAKHPEAAGQAFNISSGITTWRDFMGHYGELAGKEPKGVPVVIARLMAFANNIPGVKMPIDKGFVEMATSFKVFPINKAETILGWAPKVSYEEGMKRTKEWLIEEFEIESK